MIMVHHYEEETDAKAQEEAPETTPKFHATIVPPVVAPQSPPAYKNSAATQCDACPMAPPPGDSMLPTVLVALGIAYVVGIATGAVLFPTSAE